MANVLQEKGDYYVPFLALAKGVVPKGRKEKTPVKGRDLDGYAKRGVVVR